MRLALLSKLWENPGMLQFMGLQRVRHGLVTKQEMEKDVNDL